MLAGPRGGCQVLPAAPSVSVSSVSSGRSGRGDAELGAPWGPGPSAAGPLVLSESLKMVLYDSGWMCGVVVTLCHSVMDENSH